MRACSSCAAENGDGARYCAACGERLPAPTAAREVRKTVTVLFADVVGSTELGERLDPEAVRALMAGYFRLARTVIERHGGTVEKFVGDAVMAVFGVPLVHEDDALRAVRAAAELRDGIDRLGDLTIRVGVNTGAVIAGDASDPQTFVTGDAVNVAARLQAAGAAGEILLGPATVVLVRDAVTLGPPVALSVKGKAGPVEARRLLEVSGTAGRRRRPDAPLIGRGSEFAALEQMWRAATVDHNPHLVTLMAPPGVGKSRLVAEFAADRAEGATVLVGRCLAYGEGITYWPIREIVYGAAGITDRDSPEVARTRIETLLAAERDADVLSRRVASAIGLSTEPAAQEELFWAIRRLLEAVARRTPLLLVLEDLHWAEPTLLDLVEYALDLATDVPLLVLATARPELLETRPAWGAGRPNATLLRLEPLGPEAARELLAGLAGGSAIPASLAIRILSAAEGTPLYVEEFVGFLRDEGTLRETDDGHWQIGGEFADLVVPPTVQALLAVRLDGLPAPERMLAERASVVGRSFESAMLGDLDPGLSIDLGRRLLALVRKEVLRPDRAVLTSGDAFRFRHILIRDAAYEALPKSERAVLHERFADWLERVIGERLTEYEEIVGYHLEAAHRYRIDLGDSGDPVETLAERAATRLAAAGARAFDRGDNRAGASLAERVLRLRSLTDPRSRRLLPLYVDAMIELGALGDAGDWLERGAASAGTTDDELLGAWCEVLRSRLQSLVRDDTQTTKRSSLADATKVFVRHSDERGLARVTRDRAFELWGRGRMAAAAKKFDIAADNAERGGLLAEAAYDRSFRLAALWLGPARVHETLDAVDLELASVSHLRSAAELKITRSMALASVGRIEEARLGIRDGREILFELGLQWWAEGVMGQLAAFIERQAGDLEAARDLLEKSVRSADAIGERAYSSTTLALLADVLCELGRYDEAIEMSRLSQERSSQDDVMSEVSWRSARGRAFAAQGQGGEAEQMMDRALELIAATDMVGFQADIWRHTADLRSALGRSPRDVAAALGEARRLYDSKGWLVMRDRVQGRMDALSIAPDPAG